MFEPLKLNARNVDLLSPSCHFIYLKQELFVLYWFFLFFRFYITF